MGLPVLRLLWSLWNLHRVPGGPCGGSWRRPPWWARPRSLALCVGRAARLRGAPSGGSDVGESCAYGRHRTYDAAHRAARAEEFGRPFPVRDTCDRAYDLVPGWVNPAVLHRAACVPLATGALPRSASCGGRCRAAAGVAECPRPERRPPGPGDTGGPSAAPAARWHGSTASPRPRATPRARRTGRGVDPGWAGRGPWSWAGQRWNTSGRRSARPPISPGPVRLRESAGAGAGAGAGARGPRDEDRESGAAGGGREAAGAGRPRGRWCTGPGVPTY